MTTIQSGSLSAEGTGRTRTAPPTNVSGSLESVVVVGAVDIPALAAVEAAGEVHALGLVRDFSRHPLLPKFLARQPRGVQLSWVRLGASEVLEPHVHPIDSMIIIAKGRGELLGGKTEKPLVEGDIVLVPRTCPHGFRGGPPEGFTALSFQFGERSLYGDSEKPLVRFLDEAPVPPEEVVSAETLFSNNVRYQKRFQRFLEAEFLVSPWLRAEKERSRFLGYLRLWSDAFQRILLLRAAFAEHPEHAALAQKHLAEELGHNVMLESAGADKAVTWDAEYEASLAWFQWKLLRSGDLDKIVLVNLVAEGAADEFYRALSGELDPDGTSGHFKAHDGVDGDHGQLGTPLLVGLPAESYRRLAQLQHEGWEMMTRIIRRCAELARSIADGGRRTEARP